jgi:hypothetical protein
MAGGGRGWGRGGRWRRRGRSRGRLLLERSTTPACLDLSSSRRPLPFSLPIVRADLTQRLSNLDRIAFLDFDRVDNPRRRTRQLGSAISPAPLPLNSCLPAPGYLLVPLPSPTFPPSVLETNPNDPLTSTCPTALRRDHQNDPPSAPRSPSTSTSPPR